MKVTSLKYMLLWLVPALLLLGGCREDDPVRIDEDTITFGFTLLTSEASSNKSVGYTRAEGVDEGIYETGSASENKINLEERDYHFYIYEHVGNQDVLIYDVKDNVDIKVIANSDNSLYHVKVELPKYVSARYEGKSSANFTVVMAANWEGYGAAYPSEASIEQVAQTQFDAPSDNWMPYFNNDAGIPMYGCLYNQTVDLDKARGETGFEMPRRLNLLRSLTKIEIVDQISSDSNGNKLYISSIEFLNANDKGYLGPYGYAMNTDYQILPHLPSSVSAGQKSMLTLDTRASSSRTWMMYSVEHNMKGQALYSAEYPTSRPTLKVTVAGFSNLNDSESTDTQVADTQDYYIHFTDYSTATGRPDNSKAPWDYLLRNTIYRFIIRHISSAGLEFTVDVRPYSSVELEPEFGL